MARKNHLFHRISFHESKLNWSNQMSLAIFNKVSGSQSVELASVYSPKEILCALHLPDEVLRHIFHFLNAEELARIAPICRQWAEVASSGIAPICRQWAEVASSGKEALPYGIPFPSWLKDINAEVWEKYVDVKKYGLDISEAPRVNRYALTKALKPLSGKVENEMGITNIVIPKGLTLNKVVQIARDNSVLIAVWDEILTNFGDSAVEETCVLFFTNNIFEGTRGHTPEQHKLDVTTIGQECGIAIQRPNVRDFMAFLVLTYISSSETPPTQLYSSNTYTSLIEKVDHCFLMGGFAFFGLHADNEDINNALDDHFGVGASGSSNAF
jgi:hypothetical protein